MSIAAEGLTIRPAVTADHAACARILTESWRSAHPDKPRRVGPSGFREQTAGERVLVSASERAVVGFISVWVQEWFVHHLFVDPAFQDRGIGGTLLEHVAMLAGDRGLTLKCQAGNHGAIRFYTRFGFEPTGTSGRDAFGDWIELRGRPWREMQRARAASGASPARRR